MTIAALIDEFLLRATEPVRVLVTAFSYDAMVVLRRGGSSTTATTLKVLTRAASVQKVFLRSPDRDLPIDHPKASDLAISARE